jgi:hypothetical protein
MSIDPQFDQIVITEPSSDGVEPVTPDAPTESPAAVPPIPVVEVLAPVVQIAVAPAETEAPVATHRRIRTRPTWVVPAAIAAFGLIASGTLGWFFYSTSSSLGATKHQLGVTQASLDSTKLQLASLQADAASKKPTADYLRMYVADGGRVLTDYEQVAACQNYSVCRTAAQQTLIDMQAFQSDRQSANVPAALNSSDGELGDSLSAGIAALHELIDGMDNNSKTKIEDGFTKLNGAVLNMAKAETLLGSEIK